MSGAFEWLNRLAQAIINLWPTWMVINATEAGVKFVGGKKVVPYGPGIVFYWPARTEVKTWPIVRQPVDLPSQTITTKDGKTIAVGGAFEYEVTDVRKLLTTTFAPDASMRLHGAVAVRSVCSARTYEELMDQRAVRFAIRRELRKRLRPFGVRVLSANLTDFAPARVFKLLQSMSNDANAIMLPPI